MRAHERERERGRGRGIGSGAWIWRACCVLVRLNPRERACAYAQYQCAHHPNPLKTYTSSTVGMHPTQQSLLHALHALTKMAYIHLALRLPTRHQYEARWRRGSLACKRPSSQVHASCACRRNLLLPLSRRLALQQGHQAKRGNRNMLFQHGIRLSSVCTPLPRACAVANQSVWN